MALIELAGPEWERIESQHGRLEQLLQAFVDAAADRNHEAEVESLEQLAVVLAQHCADEEAFMAACDYPQLSGHRWEHQAMAENLEEVLQRARSGTAPISRVDGQTVHTIVVEHMKQTDAAFVRSVKQRNAAESSRKDLAQAAGSPNTYLSTT